MEVGLRALAVLAEVYPTSYSLQRLVVSDYLLVHSDDIQDGPPGLHPQTPYRSGELLVRRGPLQDGLLLYQSRGLVERQYTVRGVMHAATDESATFLDVLGTEYAVGLRHRAAWLTERFGPLDDTELQAFVSERIGKWGAEFVMESVLWAEEDL